jgi:chromatin remodeling complex protein RSC6
MESVSVDAGLKSTEWSSPREEIQRLINLDESIALNANLHKEPIHFSEEDFAKMPSTLVKIIRRTDALLEQTEQFRKAAIETNNELKGIQTLMFRYAKRILKDATKTEAKHARLESGKGFLKPCKISKEMCDFMEVEEGTMLSRVEVNQLIHDYIKDQGLVDKNNGQFINPDEKLWSILSCQERDTKITYFSLQKYIKHNFNV